MNTHFQFHPGQSGFSLVEVIAVLIILGMLAMVVTAGMDSNASAVAESEILKAHLGYAQSLAFANNTATWSLQIMANSYSLLRDGLPSPVRLPGESSTVHLLPPDVTIAQGVGSLSFDQYGAPTSTYVVVLSRGTFQESVTVTGFTGLIP